MASRGPKIKKAQAHLQEATAAAFRARHDLSCENAVRELGRAWHQHGVGSTLLRGAKGYTLNDEVSLKESGNELVAAESAVIVRCHRK
jgi:hypothetical protein